MNRAEQGHLWRMIAAIFLCVTKIGVVGCNTQKSLNEVTSMQKEFSQSDLQKLRWLEGTWRGSAGGQEFFYEGYRFINDTTIEIDFFTDSTLTKTSGKGKVAFSNKAIINDTGPALWAATSVDDRSVHFAPKQEVTNSFSWEKESPDVWIARLVGTDSQGKRIETAYRMERYKPQ